MLEGSGGDETGGEDSQQRDVRTVLVVAAGI